MGSLSSKGKKHQDTSKYGDIYLQTDKTAYHPGETVTGTIFLNLISEFPGNELFLKFKGKQAAHIVKKQRRGKYQFEIKYSEKDKIIKESVLVHSWDKLSTGQFSIPFSFLPHEFLPASFYQQGHRYLAFIEYQIEAFLKPHKETDPKMKYKQPINLRNKIVPVTGNLTSNVTTALKTCCCCKQGSNFLKANFEKNYYSPGEKAQVTMELDNSGTSLKNKNVVFGLGQWLEITAAGKTLRTHTTKVKQQLPGIPSGSTKNAGTLNVVLPQFPTKADFKEIDKNNPSKWVLLRLRDNNNVITSTTSSTLMSSSYHLEVTCPMSGCCTTLPIAQIPIGIYSPDIQLPTVTAPANWQPIALDSITLAFPYSQNQPMQSEANGQMVEGQMIQNDMPQNQLNVEMAQISMPQSNQYNQDYYK